MTLLIVRILLLLTQIVPPSRSCISAFGTNIVYDPPDSTTWSLTQSSIDEHKKLGVVVYKRVPINDDDGVPIRPVLAIIFERLPDTTDAVSFSISKRISSSPRWKVRNATAPDSTEYPSAVFYEGEYDLQGVKHVIVVAHATHALVGVQVIADATDGVYSKVENEMKRFVHSIFLFQ
jgi:hypothetical protein